MGWFDNDDLVPVEIDCRCPGNPHDKDTVSLYPKLTAEGGMAGEQFYNAIISGEIPTVETMVGKLGVLFLLHGVADWTFVDEEGKRIPATARNIARFSRNWEAAKPVAEKADELYAEQMTRPLVERLSTRSNAGQTGTSTSATRTGSATPRKRSKRSTTATTRPSLRVMTSSAGDSSTSQKKSSDVA